MSQTATSLRVLLLPGWQNSGAAHWQSVWEQAHGYARVTQHDWDTPKRGDWVARLEEVVIESDASVVLVAHSLGCQLVAAWSAISRNTARVRAALLVAPPDLDQADLPHALLPWRPMVLQPLKFRATVVISNNDPFGKAERSREMAAAWRAEKVLEIGDKGHINGDSQLGSWPQGHALLTPYI
jgi:uncharacterized protein